MRKESRGKGEGWGKINLPESGIRQDPLIGAYTRRDGPADHGGGKSPYETTLLLLLLLLSSSSSALTVLL